MKVEHDFNFGQIDLKFQARIAEARHFEESEAAESAHGSLG